MDLVVRPASAGDARRVAQIYVESWNVGFGPLMPPQVLDEGRISRWLVDLTTGPTKWWVAEVEESLAGFVGIGPSRDPIDPRLGELDTIAVDPTWWRSGVGTVLMSTALQALVDGGFQEAILWTLAGYDRGQRFYESTGWIRDGGVRDEGRHVSFKHSLQGLESA